MQRRRVDLDKSISEDIISKKSTPHLREAKKWLESLLEMRKAQKLYDTYVKGIRRATEFNESERVLINFISNPSVNYFFYTPL